MEQGVARYVHHRVSIVRCVLRPRGGGGGYLARFTVLRSLISALIGARKHAIGRKQEKKKSISSIEISSIVRKKNRMDAMKGKPETRGIKEESAVSWIVAQLSARAPRETFLLGTRSKVPIESIETVVRSSWFHVSGTTVMGASFSLRDRKLAP